MSRHSTTLSFSLTVAFVVITQISCGHLARNRLQEDAIRIISAWLGTNLNPGEGGNPATIAVDDEHQNVATAVATRLIAEQAEPINSAVRLVDGGAVWLLIFPSIPGGKDDLQVLANIKATLEEDLEKVKDDLVKLRAEGILAQHTEAVCDSDKKTLKACTVFVKGDAFLYRYQNTLIVQESKKRFGDCFASLDVDNEELPPVPMSSKAILQAINHSELKKDKNNPILKKSFQPNKFLVRKVIFDGKLNPDEPYNILESNMKSEHRFAKNLKLEPVACLVSTIPAFGVVLCKDGSFCIVQCCSEPQKIFDASFAKKVESQEIHTPANTLDSAASSSSIGSGNPLQTTEPGVILGNQNGKSPSTATAHDARINELAVTCSPTSEPKPLPEQTVPTHAPDLTDDQPEGMKRLAPQYS